MDVPLFMKPVPWHLNGFQSFVITNNTTMNYFVPYTISYSTCISSTYIYRKVTMMSKV